MNLFPSQDGAELSACGQYRYRLWREWDADTPRCAFIMLNPSTADADTNDPTITRCIARARELGCGRLDVVNLYPLRATDPDQLLRHPSPAGPRGKADGAILDAVDGARYVICAWGAHSAAPARADEVLRLIVTLGFGNALYHLGLNKDGSPKHPLYLPSSARPKRWSP